VFSLPPSLNCLCNGCVVDLTPFGVDKGTGVKFVLDMLQIDPCDAAFVFNDENDLPVLSSSSLNGIVTVKVGAQLPHVCADYKVSTPSDVADVLRELLMRSRKDERRVGATRNNRTGADTRAAQGAHG
jgi:hydroxymethylpyrimidine pyrophosphatase-like HAD family hydrolase